MAKIAPTMNGTEALAQSLEELRSFLEGRSWKYCLVGGLAANRWGQPRFTRDIDITVFAEIGSEDAVVGGLLTAFSSRIDSSEAKQFAIENRVLLLTSRAGIPIDVALGALAFEEQMLARARACEILPDIRFPVATAEDLVVMKTIAGRPQDWLDIEGILAKQIDKLDWAYIDIWLPPLLELIEASERALQLTALNQKVEAGAALKKKPKKPPKPEQ